MKNAYSHIAKKAEIGKLVLLKKKERQLICYLYHAYSIRVNIITNVSCKI